MRSATVGAELGNGNDWTFEQRERYLKEQEEKEAERRKQEEQNSPFNVWAQLNLEPDVCKARRQLMRDCPCAAIILDFFIQHASKYDNALIVSQRTLSEALGYSLPAINKAVNLLIERKFVDIVRSGKAVIYTISSNLTWKSWGKNYKYCKFNATVLVGENEQEKAVKITKNRVIALKEDSQQPRKDSQQAEESEWEDCPSWDREECPEE